MSLDLTNTTILFADDESSITRFVKMMLDDLRVSHVYAAKDGNEALELLGEYPDEIDLVICDWNMPSLSGIDLLMQIRTVDSDMPFLMMTGRRDVDSVIRARDAGITDYLAKPFSAEQLEEKIARLGSRAKRIEPGRRIESIGGQ